MNIVIGVIMGKPVLIIEKDDKNQVAILITQEQFDKLKIAGIEESELI